MVRKTVTQPWKQWYEERMKFLQLPEISVYTLLDNTAKKFPNHTAIIFEDNLIDYKNLKLQVDKLAGKWKELGFVKGERIGLMMANHPYFIVSYYAAQALGLIVVQLNPMYKQRELLQILIDSNAKYIVFDQTAANTVEETKGIYDFVTCINTDDEQNDSHSLRSMIEFGEAIKTPECINPYEDTAVIQYTGGTTGKMKGVMLTHYNLTSNVVQSFEMYGDSMIPGEEIVLASTPLYHVYAMTSAMNLGIYIGASILLFPKFEVQNVLDNIKKYRPTFFPGVPKMYNAFVNHPEIENYGLDCLRNCSCGSAPLPVEVMKRFEVLTGAKIGEGFGLSEASPSTHRNPPFGKRKIGSIGIPFPGTDCLIIDDDNNEVPNTGVGELLIKGPQIMKGYWNNESETKKALQNDWLYTGDLAVMDEEGYFYIVGRKKEMIIVSGFNIYPQEVEGVLYEHPTIKEAAVVGISHKEIGEVVKAFIVPKENASIDLDEIEGYCYSQLTPYKVPKEFEIRKELPRNTVGKLLKRLLIKEELEKEEKSE
ncbi:long-chain-fatty-acid--CoA ligase [Peribacillus butanolivorans]|uniref:Long-chain fatty acid--CoA ligase n=1 Tax=Peribacillus butanolivorans TaxID=421767 RepID=A0ABN5NBW3_9BACI|nr:long-chain fatty acid--CoA ligase [Peribacillus butanolivorans]